MMQIIVAQDRSDMGRFVASQAAEILRKKLAEKQTCRIVVATGSSQFEVLDSLAEQTDIDWSRIDGFHLDEYLGIERSHSASFCNYLQARFVDRVPLKSFFFLDGTVPPEELKHKAGQAITSDPVDLLLCGIGENGHLAFNDPPADFDTSDPYLIVELDEACRRQQVGEGWFDSLAEVPTKAISMSIHQILQSEHILCSVPDRRKSEAVRATVEDPISVDVPASALRNHSQTTLILDSSSSSLLSEPTLQQCQHLDPSAN